VASHGSSSRPSVGSCSDVDEIVRYTPKVGNGLLPRRSWADSNPSVGGQTGLCRSHEFLPGKFWRGQRRLFIPSDRNWPLSRLNCPEPPEVKEYFPATRETGFVQDFVVGHAYTAEPSTNRLCAGDWDIELAEAIQLRLVKIV
jgi:hypothetical protein